MDRGALSVGVIGLGVGEQHVMAYQQHPRCIVAALCDVSEEKRKWAKKMCPEARVTSDPADIIENPDIDLVSIASYDDAHFQQVVAALQAGKHVFVEKPLCRSLGELKIIKDLWREKGSLNLASNLVLRSAPLYRWLRAVIRDGRLGDVYAFDGDYLYGRLQKITEGWRKDVVDYSVMEGGGIHLIDLMLWLTGEVPVSVTSVGNKRCTLGTAFRFHDFVSSTFRFSSGLIGRVTANFGCMHRHQHVVRVFGTKGTFISDDRGVRLHESRDPAAFVTPIDYAAVPPSKGDLIPPFVNSIIDRSWGEGEIQHECNVICICEASDQALHAGHEREIVFL